jgi:hypothetical protein
MVPEVRQALDTLDKPEQGEAPVQPVEPELRVLTTDAAFHSQETRRALRGAGIIENTHLSSHANRDSSKTSASSRTKKRYQIDGYPNWFATGHRELVCACEQGKTTRVAEIGTDGRATVRIKGECDQCKSILITSGLWRLSKSRKFVKCTPNERDAAEFSFGNPLTFHDTLAKQYGEGRFNGQEGAFGSQFTQRFRLLKDKRWFYRQSQVDLEVAAVITITHALSLERYRRKNAGLTGDATSQPEMLAA